MKTKIIFLLLIAVTAIKANTFIYSNNGVTDTIDIDNLYSQLDAEFVDTLYNNLKGDAAKDLVQYQLVRIFGTQFMTEVLVYGALEGKNENVIKMLKILLSENAHNKEKLALFLKCKADAPLYTELKDSIIYYVDNMNRLGCSKLIGYIDEWHIGLKHNGYEGVLINKNAWIKADEAKKRKYY